MEINGGLMSSALGTGLGTQLVLKSQGCCNLGTGLVCTEVLPPGIRHGCTLKFRRHRRGQE